MSASPSTMAMSRCIKESKIDTLIIMIESDRLSVMSLRQSLKDLGAETVAVALAAFSQNKHTTALHAMFRTARHALLSALLQHLLPHAGWLHTAVEPESKHNIYHVLACRPLTDDERTSSEFMRLFHGAFLEAPAGALEALDASQLSVVHYLAMSEHHELHKRLLDRCDGLRRVESRSKLSSHFLRAEKLDRKLEQTSQQVRHLRRELANERTSAQDIQDRHSELSKAAVKMQTKIGLLERQLGVSESQAQKLTQSELAYIGATDAARAEIETLRSERDHAKKEAKVANEALRYARKQLDSAKRDKEQKLDAVEESRQMLVEQETELDAAVAEREKLARELELARREMDETTAETNERAKQQIEKAVREAERQLEDAENDCAKLQKAAAQAGQQLSTLEAELNEREQELLRLQSAYNDAETQNDSLAEELRTATEKQRLMEQRAERLQHDLEQVVAEQEASNKQQAELREQMRVEHSALRTQVSDAQTLIKTTEQQLAEERERADAALADARDAQSRAQLLEKSEAKQQELQAQLAHLSAAQEKLTSRLEAQREASQRELDELNEELDEARERAEEAEARALDTFQRVTEWKEYHETTVTPLREEMTRVRESLRVAQQSLEETRTNSHAERAKLSAEVERLRAQLEADSDTEAQMTSARDAAVKKRAGGGSAGKILTPRPRTLSRKETLRRAALASTDEQQRIIEDAMRLNIESNMAFWTQLTNHVACVRNSLSGSAAVDPLTEVNSLLDRGISANSVDVKTGRCLLEVAVRAAEQSVAYLHKTGLGNDKMIADHVAMVQLLLGHGAEWSGMLEYVEAVRCGEQTLNGKRTKAVNDKRIVDILSNKDDYSPFLKALLDNNPVKVSHLVDSLQDVDYVPKLKDSSYKDKEYSLVHIAVINATDKARVAPNETCLRALVSRGADCTVPDREDRQPLHLALIKNIERRTLLKVCRYLLAGGADPEETTTNKQFIAMCSGTASIKTKVSRIASRGSKSMKEETSKQTQKIQRYGTPMAFAKHRNDKELLELFKNRRFRKIDAATLVEYITQSVQFRCVFDQLDATVQAGDAFDVVCKRYQDVFEYFNPRYTAIYGPNSIEKMLQKDADIGLDETEEQVARKVAAMVEADERFIDQVAVKSTGCGSVQLDRLSDDDQRAFVDRLPQGSPASGNDGPLFAAIKFVKGCMQALLSRWFDVDELIRRPALLLFPEAVLSALCDFIRHDKLAEMRKMLARTDRLYGDIGYDTVLHEAQQFRAIDLAAHYGSIRCLEFLMSKQRERLGEPGPSHRTIVSIADRQAQTLAIVAFDKFRYDQGLAVERDRHEHSQMYASTADSGDTVLHRAVQVHRYDLLAFCIDQVQFHCKTANAGGETPLDMALRISALPMNNDHELQQLVRCVRKLQATVDGTDDTESTSEAAMLAPPPTLAMPGNMGVSPRPPPPARRSPTQHKQQPPPPPPPLDLPVVGTAPSIDLEASDDSDSDDGQPVTPRKSRRRHRRSHGQSLSRSSSSKRQKGESDDDDGTRSLGGSGRRRRHRHRKGSRHDNAVQSEIF